MEPTVKTPQVTSQAAPGRTAPIVTFSIGLKGGQTIRVSTGEKDALPCLVKALEGESEVKTKKADIYHIGRLTIRLSEIAYIQP